MKNKTYFFMGIEIKPKELPKSVIIAVLIQAGYFLYVLSTVIYGFATNTMGTEFGYTSTSRWILYTIPQFFITYWFIVKLLRRERVIQLLLGWAYSIVGTSIVGYYLYVTYKFILSRSKTVFPPVSYTIPVLLGGILVLIVGVLLLKGKKENKYFY